MKLTYAMESMLAKVPVEWGDTDTSFTNGTLNALKARGLIEIRRRPVKRGVIGLYIQWKRK